MSINLLEKLYVVPSEFCVVQNAVIVDAENISWHQGLIAWVRAQIEATEFFFTEVRLNDHIGRDSIFRLKKHLSDQLKFLFISYLKNNTLSRSEQKMIALKLNEGAQTCSEGFFNRVEELMHRFQRPKSFGGLIYSLRWDIVNKCANRYTGVNQHLIGTT